MVLTRAFACATPVVASDIDGYREVVTPETAVTVPPDDVPALVDGVERAPRGRAAARRDGCGGARRSPSAYAWTDIAARLEGIYERVVVARAGRRARREAPRSALPQPVGARPRGARHARRRPRRALVARAGVGHGLRRVRSSSAGAGCSSPSCSTSLSVDRRGPGPGTSRSTRRCRSRTPLRGGVLGLRRRPARERRAARASRRARAGRRPAPAPAREERLRARRCSAPSSRTGCSTSSRSRSSSATSLLTAKIPHWAVTGVVIVGLVGTGSAHGRDPLGATRARRARRTGSRPRAGCSRWRARVSPCCASPRRLACDPVPDRRLDAAAPRRLGGRRRRSTSTSRSRPRRSSSC